MSELSQFAVPIVTGAVGYGAGQYLEQSARQYIADKREALFGAHEDVSGDSQSLLGRVATALALTGAAAGVFAGEAIEPLNSQQTEKPPVLAVAVDHSFGVRSGKTLQTINSIAKSSADLQSNNIKVTARVAHNGSSDKADSVKYIFEDAPYGPPSIKKATTASLEDAGNTASIAETSAVTVKKTDKSGAVLSVTDGNSIGKPSTIAKLAKKNGNLPIYIANVGNGKSDTAKELKTIAKTTNGAYWHTNDANEVISLIKKNIASKPNKENDNNNNRILFGALALGMAGLTFRMYKQRKNEVFGSVANA